MRPNPQETGDLVTFAAKICNGKLHLLCSFKNKLISQKLEKIEKTFMTFFKSLGEYLIKFNELEAISRHLTALIMRW